MDGPGNGRWDGQAGATAGGTADGGGSAPAGGTAAVGGRAAGRRPGRLGRAVSGTVGAVRGALDDTVASQARSVVDELEPYLAAETVPRIVTALLPDLVDRIVPAVVDGVTDHLAARTVPAVLEGAMPALVDEILPMLLAELLPYLEAELVPAVLDAVTPHVVARTAPAVLEGLLPQVRQVVVPLILADVAADPRIRGMVRQQSLGLVTDGVDRLRRWLRRLDDGAERLLGRLVGRRRGPAGAASGHAGLVTRAVAAGADLALVSFAGGLAVTAFLAVADAVLRPAPGWLARSAAAAAAVLAPAYFALGWRLAGRTVAGAVAGFAVVRPDGTPLRLPAAALRAVAVVYLVPLSAAGLLLSVRDPWRRGLLDRICGSRTPYLGDPTPLAAVPAASPIPPVTALGDRPG
ncbi:MAG TPA: RDD family protein [Mycobacteriales bacterium]